PGALGAATRGERGQDARGGGHVGEGVERSQRQQGRDAARGDAQRGGPPRAQPPRPGQNEEQREQEVEPQPGREGGGGHGQVRERVPDPEERGQQQREEEAEDVLDLGGVDRERHVRRQTGTAL